MENSLQNVWIALHWVRFNWKPRIDCKTQSKVGQVDRKKRVCRDCPVDSPLILLLLLICILLYASVIKILSTNTTKDRYVDKYLQLINFYLDMFIWIFFQERKIKANLFIFFYFYLILNQINVIFSRGNIYSLAFFIIL